MQRVRDQYINEEQPSRNWNDRRGSRSSKHFSAFKGDDTPSNQNAAREDSRGAMMSPLRDTVRVAEAKRISPKKSRPGKSSVLKDRPRALSPNQDL